MIMSLQALRAFVNRHMPSAAALAALGAALDAKANGQALEPALAARVKAFLEALGAGDVLDDATADEVRPVLTEIRMMNAVDAKLLHAHSRQTSWTYTDAALLEGAGAMSAGFVTPLAQVLLPSLDGATDALSRKGATFLDVGVGVAGLAIALARRWPELRIVGIDPWQPSLALARQNVAKAGLDERIELREQRAEDLSDEAAFDIAWLPAIFMPRAAVRPACERILRSLRPGAWMLFNAVQPGDDPTTDALWYLRTTMFGNSAMTVQETETLLRDVGYADVRTLCSPAGSFMRLVGGRRAA